MKKLKLLPSILMLIACLAILAVGVYSIAPTQNTISGSITINSTNPEVLISAYKYDTDGYMENTPFFAETSARKGVNIDLGSLSFDASNANSEEDLQNLDIKITVRIVNPSNQHLGVYFSTTAVADSATAEDIKTTKALTDSTGATTNVMAKMDDYKLLHSSKNGTNGQVDVTLKFSLLQFIDGSTATVDLASEANKIYLNIEAFNEDIMWRDYTKVGESGQTLTNDMVLVASNNDLTSITKLRINNNVTIDYSAFYGCSNLKILDVSFNTINLPGSSWCNDSVLDEANFIGTTISVYGAAYLGNYGGPNAKKVDLSFSNISYFADFEFSGSDVLEEVVLTGCDSLIDIDNSGSYSPFSGCTKLKSFYFPKNIERLSFASFYGCIGLRKIVFEAGITDLAYRVDWEENVESLIRMVPDGYTLMVKDENGNNVNIEEPLPTSFAERTTYYLTWTEN